MSPDEIALVKTAKNHDYIFLGVENNETNLKIRGELIKIEILNIFEFNSNRKRMSIIVKENNIIKLYIKGADNIIKPRLSYENKEFLEEFDNVLNNFSKKGLRTLCIAMREITEEEYFEFNNEYKKLIDVENREEKVLNLAANKLEKQLFLLGCTAIEDKLQENVPEVIQDFIKADINVWMLTGDKLETAECIAYSCNLFNESLKILCFNNEELNEEKLIQKLSEENLFYKKDKKIGIIIDSEIFHIIDQDKDLTEKFINLSNNAQSVVFCRATPKQKAKVVNLVRKKMKRLTLAVGDGANDVNMIQQANIGIGIYGEEGLRAVQSSDFAVGEFQCLWKLIFVHGRWNYHRNSNLILYFFYKNMLFTIPQFFWSFFNFFSGQTLFDDFYISGFNLFFTNLPILIRGIFEQDLVFKKKLSCDELEKNKSNFYEENTPKNLIENKLFKSFIKNDRFAVCFKQFKQMPILYWQGFKNTIFNKKNFLFWVFQGIFQAILIFFFNLLIFKQAIESNGLDFGFWSFNTTIFTSIIIVADLKLALEIKFWTWLHWLSLIPLSLGVYFLYFIVSNWANWGWVQNVPLFLLQSYAFYLSFCFCSFIILLVEFLLLYLKKKN